ncbi:MAG: hypothetical protein HFG75_07410 [Hungatella sp.]|nr:hypothetical protein [Hungatella sp.]
MESISSILRRKILEIMADGEARSVADIKESLESQKNLIYKKDFTEGHLAGTLRVLKETGKLEQEIRGIYRLSKRSQDSEQKTEILVIPVGGEGNRRPQLSEEPAKEYWTGETFKSLKKEILDRFQDEYECLKECLNASSVGALDMEEFKRAGELLELKNDLEKILRKNHRMMEMNKKN